VERNGREEEGGEGPLPLRIFLDPPLASRLLASLAYQKQVCAVPAL